MIIITKIFVEKRIREQLNEVFKFATIALQEYPNEFNDRFNNNQPFKNERLELLFTSSEKQHGYFCSLYETMEENGTEFLIM